MSDKKIMGGHTPNEIKKQLEQLAHEYIEPEWALEYITKLEAEIADWEASFELYDSASMRAIKMWKERTGEDKTWPDQAKLIVWLMEEYEALIKEN